MLTALLHIVHRLRMSAAINLLPLHDLMVCRGNKFEFLFAEAWGLNVISILTGNISWVMWKWCNKFCVFDHEVGFTWRCWHISPFCPLLTFKWLQFKCDRQQTAALSFRVVKFRFVETSHVPTDTLHHASCD